MDAKKHKEGIIDSYSRLPLGKWLEIRAISEGTGDALDKQVAILAILADTNEETILSLPLEEYSARVVAARFLEREDTGAHRLARAYRAGGFTLIPTTDIRKMNVAQYVDFQKLSPGGEAALVELLSVFLVPKGCTYGELKDYDINAVRDAIAADISVSDALAMIAFFLKKFGDLMADTLNSLERAARGLKDKTKRTKMLTAIAEQRRAIRSVTAGDGRATSTR